MKLHLSKLQWSKRTARGTCILCFVLLAYFGRNPAIIMAQAALLLGLIMLINACPDRPIDKRNGSQDD